MKKFNLLLSLVFILAIALGINAQVVGGAVSSNSDDFKQLSELQSKSWAYKRNGPYREKTERVFQHTGKEVKLVTIQEFVPPDRSRFQSSTTVEGTTSTYETITIGGDMYFRENGGKWTLPKADEVGGETRSGVGNSTTKLIEKTTLDGKPVIVFEEKWNEYFDDKSSSGVTTSWFTEDGHLLKSVKKTDVGGDQPSGISTSTYEYDVKIEIQKPVVK